MGKKLIVEKYWRTDVNEKDNSMFSNLVKPNNNFRENVPLQTNLNNVSLGQSQDCQGCTGGGYKANLKTLVSFFVGCFNPKLNRVYWIDENEVMEEIDNFGIDDVAIDNVPIEVVIYTDIDTYFYETDAQKENLVKKGTDVVRYFVYSSEDTLQGKTVKNIKVNNLQIDSNINILKNVRDYNFAKFRKFQLNGDKKCTKYCQTVSLTTEDVQEVSVQTKCDANVTFSKIIKNQFIDDVPVSVKVNGYDMFTRMVSRLMVKEKEISAKSYVFYYEDDNKISFYMTGSYFYIIRKMPKQIIPEGGAQPYVTILGRRRKVFKIGRSRFVKVHGANVKLSDAKKLEKKHS